MKLTPFLRPRQPNLFLVPVQAGPDSVLVRRLVIEALGEACDKLHRLGAIHAVGPDPSKGLAYRFAADLVSDYRRDAQDKL